MSQMLTVELSDDDYEEIKKAAEATGQRPAEWVAMNLRRQLSVLRKGSPSAILRAMREPPHLTPPDVDALEQAIATGKLPVRWEPVFEEETGPPQ